MDQQDKNKHLEPVNPYLNPFLAKYLANTPQAVASRKLQKEREWLIADLKETGEAPPFTVLNFNPVPLTLDGGIRSVVPPFTDSNATGRMIYGYEGVNYRAAMLTISDPIIFPWILGVEKKQGQDVGIYQMRVCKPVEIAYSFLRAFCQPHESTVPMGGVVAFKGGPERLVRNDGEKIQVEVPRAIRYVQTLPFGYSTAPFDLDEVIRASLVMQKAYCQSMTEKAQSLWDVAGPTTEVHNIHKLWHQYELDKGWSSEPAEWLKL